MLDSSYDYSQELDITWLRDPLQFHYLREEGRDMNSRARGPGKSRPLTRSPNILVGYVKLKPTAKAGSPGRFHRRYWWLMERDLSDFSGWKCEAVDPRSIRVGQPSSHEPLPPSTQL